MCAKATMEEFEALLNESFEIDTPNEGSVVKGKVIAIEAGQAIIDVGYKMEGRVELKEFASPGEAPEIAVGDETDQLSVANHRQVADAATSHAALSVGEGLVFDQGDHIGGHEIRDAHFARHRPPPEDSVTRTTTLKC